MMVVVVMPNKVVSIIEHTCPPADHQLIIWISIFFFTIIIIIIITTTVIIPQVVAPSKSASPSVSLQGRSQLIRSCKTQKRNAREKKSRSFLLS
jgi:hypothetical protein